MSLADGVLGLAEISAFARPENAGSRRVLEKAGFEVLRFISELDRFLYRRGRRGPGPRPAGRNDPGTLGDVGMHNNRPGSPLVGAKVGVAARR